jgi:hypothetical protein
MTFRLAKNETATTAIAISAVLILAVLSLVGSRIVPSKLKHASLQGAEGPRQQERDPEERGGFPKIMLNSQSGARLACSGAGVYEKAPAKPGPFCVVNVN